MAVARDGVGGLADEDVGKVSRTEPFASTHHGRENLLGIDGSVVSGGAVGAEVAAAATLTRFTEIRQQCLAAAERRLAEVRHRRQPLQLDAALLGRNVLLADLAAAE